MWRPHLTYYIQYKCYDYERDIMIIVNYDIFSIYYRYASFILYGLLNITIESRYYAV